MAVLGGVTPVLADPNSISENPQVLVQKIVLGAAVGLVGYFVKRPAKAPETPVVQSPEVSAPAVPFSAPKSAELKETSAYKHLGNINDRG